MKKPLQVVDKNKYHVKDTCSFITSDNVWRMGSIVQVNKTTLDIKDDYNDGENGPIYRISLRYIEKLVHTWTGK